ncbi:HlyD family efflux transporter periplasmic adaptor subunit [Hoylesella saccharolytica]|uniref:HlyD family secretion protein n=1 Tax=Hoylesella saccharolytica TaxID=633701 RepID=UPI0028EED4D9|nr:HlyD family efflux transporter periplasmic adaptor subunit [Hoylesella saccharolytica]
MKKIMICTATLTLLVSSCGSSDKEFDATGIFEATEVTVSAEATGRLMTFDVTEGSRVNADRQVGLIDTVQLQLKAEQVGATRESFANQRPNVQAQVAATRQQLVKAQLERTRTAALLKDGAATRKQMDDADNAVRVLKSQLEAQVSMLNNSARSLNSQMSGADIQRYQVLDQLKKCHITSPITGTVLEKYAERGEFAVIGKPLFKVADVDQMYLRAYITSAQLAKVKVGQRVKVFSDYGTDTRKSYDGTVTWISSRAEFTPKTILTDDERADLVYAVKIAVKNDGYIKIGMYGEVKL